MPAVDRGGGVLIALHGHGDDPAAARTWGRQMAPAGWEVVAPGARVGDDGVRSWFSSGPRGADTGEVRASAQKIGDLVDRLRSGGSRVVVAGFSQGGALALALGSFGIRPDGLISICGFFPELDRAVVGFGAAEGDTEVASDSGTSAPTTAPALVVNTEDDEVVPAYLGADAAALLSAAGTAVTVELVPGDHRVGAAALEFSRRWLTRVLGPSVKVSLGLPVDRVHTGDELVSGSAIVDLSVAYERLGFHAAYVTDHPAPDDRWLAGGGHQALEPTVALAMAASATRRLLLHTNVYVLPYRNPFLAAKALSSVDVLSGGRLIVGVAAGYLRPEFAALGADFDARGPVLEKSIATMTRVWTESSVAGEGPGWTARGVTSLPHPSTPPPIWVGGNSAAALRRAVQLGQGWSPFPTPVGSGKGLRTAEISSIDALAARLEQVPAVCEQYERVDPLTICFVPFTLAAYLADPDEGRAALVAEVAQLTEIGVDWVALMVPGETRAEVLDHAAALSRALRLT